MWSCELRNIRSPDDRWQHLTASRACRDVMFCDGIQSCASPPYSKAQIAGALASLKAKIERYQRHRSIVAWYIAGACPNQFETWYSSPVSHFPVPQTAVVERRRTKWAQSSTRIPCRRSHTGTRSNRRYRQAAPTRCFVSLLRWLLRKQRPLAGFSANDR